MVRRVGDYRSGGSLSLGKQLRGHIERWSASLPTKERKTQTPVELFTARFNEYLKKELHVQQSKKDQLTPKRLEGILQGERHINAFELYTMIDLVGLDDTARQPLIDAAREIIGPINLAHEERLRADAKRLLPVLLRMEAEEQASKQRRAQEALDKNPQKNHVDAVEERRGKNSDPTPGQSI